MTHKSFYGALRELQDKRIIAQSGNTGFWFVNMSINQSEDRLKDYV
jgi:hypothetical protein